MSDIKINNILFPPDGVEYGIILDTETTGLENANKGDVSKQPYIVEYAGIKVNWETLEEVDRFEFLCKPPIECPADAVAIHGISNEVLADEKPFAAYYEALAEFHLGVTHCVAHNYTYDRNMIFYELKRMKKQMNFPYPIESHCTVEISYALNNYRLNLTKMAKQLLDKEHEEAHRAMPDVEMLTDCVRALREKEMI